MQIIFSKSVVLLYNVAKSKYFVTMKFLSSNILFQQNTVHTSQVVRIGMLLYKYLLRQQFPTDAVTKIVWKRKPNNGAMSKLSNDSTSNIYIIQVCKDINPSQ